MRRFLLVALLANVVGTPPVRAQQRDSLAGPDPLLLERTYVFHNFPDDKTNAYYEALLALHFPFRNSVQSANDRVLLRDRRWQRAVALTGSMLVNLRQTTESSAPVRTPSYMPKVTAQWILTRRVDPATTLAARQRSAVELWLIPFTFGHYSNGQDGCLFQHQRLTIVNGDTLCAADPAIPSEPRRVNRKDGSFSSHYLQLGAFYRRITMSDTLQAGSEVTARSFWTLGVQVRAYQPVSWIGGGMNKELRDAYGPLRVRAFGNRVKQTSWGIGPGQFRLEGWAEYIDGHPPEMPAFRGAIEIARTMDKRGGWGVFARAYAGHDDYNLGFLTDIGVLQVGLTTGGERMPRYRISLM